MLLQRKVSFKHYAVVTPAAVQQLALTQIPNFKWDVQKCVDTSQPQNTSTKTKPITVKPSPFQTWNASVFPIFVISPDFWCSFMFTENKVRRHSWRLKKFVPNHRMSINYRCDGTVRRRKLNVKVHLKMTPTEPREVFVQ